MKQAASPTEGAAKISQVLRDGSALDKFRNILKAQGVATEVADALCAENANVINLLPEARNKTRVTTQQAGINGCQLLVNQHILQVGCSTQQRGSGDLVAPKFKEGGGDCESIIFVRPAVIN